MGNDFSNYVRCCDKSVKDEESVIEQSFIRDNCSKYSKTPGNDENRQSKSIRTHDELSDRRSSTNSEIAVSRSMPQKLEEIFKNSKIKFLQSRWRAHAKSVGILQRIEEQYVRKKIDEVELTKQSRTKSKGNKALAISTKHFKSESVDLKDNDESKRKNKNGNALKALGLNKMINPDDKKKSSFKESKIIFKESKKNIKPNPHINKNFLYPKEEDLILNTDDSCSSKSAVDETFPTIGCIALNDSIILDFDFESDAKLTHSLENCEIADFLNGIIIRNANGLVNATYSMHPTEKFEGEFINNKIQGYGIWRNQSNFRIEGYWKNKKPHQICMERSPGKFYYLGECRSGIMFDKRAVGTCFFSDGSKYEGEFENQYFNGWVNNRL